MRKFKKIIALFLSVLFISSTLPVSVFAADRVKTAENMSSSKTFTSSELIELGISALDAKIKTENDLNLLQASGVQLNNVSEISVYNGKISYVVDNPNFENTVIYQVEELNSGDIRYDFYEEEKHDVVIVTSSDELYLNGNLVVVTETPSKINNISPRAQWVSHISSTPFIGTYNDYLTYEGYYDGSIFLDGIALNMTVAAISFVIFNNVAEIIATGIIPEPEIKGVFTSALFDTIASGVQTVAMQHAPNANTVTYTRSDYSAPSLSIGGLNYYRHTLMYKVAGVYVPNSLTQYYESCMFV